MLDPEALFEEARQHRRRRRLRLSLSVAVLVAAGVATYFFDDSGAPHGKASSHPAAVAALNREKRLSLKIYFKANASPREENAVAEKLKANPDIASLKYISKAAALNQLRKVEPSVVENLAHNPLPDSYVVTLSKSKYAQAVRSSLYPLPPGVVTVLLGRS